MAKRDAQLPDGRQALHAYRLGFNPANLTGLLGAAWSLADPSGSDFPDPLGRLVTELVAAASGLRPALSRAECGRAESFTTALSEAWGEVKEAWMGAEHVGALYGDPPAGGQDGEGAMNTLRSLGWGGIRPPAPEIDSRTVVARSPLAGPTWQRFLGEATTYAGLLGPTLAEWAKLGATVAGVFDEEEEIAPVGLGDHLAGMAQRYRFLADFTDLSFERCNADARARDEFGPCPGARFRQWVIERVADLHESVVSNLSAVDPEECWITASQAQVMSREFLKSGISLSQLNKMCKNNHPFKYRKPKKNRLEIEPAGFIRYLQSLPAAARADGDPAATESRPRAGGSRSFTHRPAGR